VFFAVFFHLHPSVVGSAATFGRDPNDVLCGIFDIARFAVHAVLRVDLQAITVVIVLDVFVDARRAVARLWASINIQVDTDWNGRVFQRQMRRLLFFVIGITNENAAEAVKRELAIGFGVVNGRALRRRF
jgi:hypothetical protein